jgi:hypothetical protein
MEEISALAAEANRQAVRRPFARREEAGLIQELGDHLARGYLSADMIGVFMLVCVELERGEAFAPRGRVERDPDGEPVLVVSRSYGLTTERMDWRGSLSSWQKGLTHLAKNRWLELDASSGNEYRIRLGSRAKRAMRAAPPKARAA